MWGLVWLRYGNVVWEGEGRKMCYVGCVNTHPQPPLPWDLLLCWGPVLELSYLYHSLGIFSV